MSKIIYDNIKKTATATVSLINSLDESKIYNSKSNYGFAVDVVLNKTYGNDAYFKVYQMQAKQQVKKNGLFIASRIYFTKPFYFTHNNEPDPTILWNFSSKDKKNIHNILSSPAASTVNVIKGLNTDAVLAYNLTTYQYLIFIFNKLNKEIRGIPYSDEEIIYNSADPYFVDKYFISVNYPMPDYKNMELLK